MDALEFLKEERRMCASFDAICVKCPLGDTGCCVIVGDTDRELENEVTAVEQWSKEHPRKTRQSVFLEQWPETEIDQYGYLMVCPKRISADCRIRYGNCANRVCSDCHREFWGQEVE
nr:MAG TPA: hypothetical protein [Caudoviricetes sp.]